MRFAPCPSAIAVQTPLKVCGICFNLTHSLPLRSVTTNENSIEISIAHKTARTNSVGLFPWEGSLMVLFLCCLLFSRCLIFCCFHSCRPRRFSSDWREECRFPRPPWLLIFLLPTATPPSRGRSGWRRWLRPTRLSSWPCLPPRRNAPTWHPLRSGRASTRPRGRHS